MRNVVAVVVALFAQHAHQAQVAVRQAVQSQHAHQSAHRQRKLAVVARAGRRQTQVGFRVGHSDAVKQIDCFKKHAARQRDIQQRNDRGERVVV
ncbi:hypothetical protein [Accumulibacter sp.]|uniref:hypothetical protein n=1 Tax=Accumulibacter sp. TaxID=2053492 RepID=UPI0028C3F526|nr:hypothetical protein [Accumulibacter sp.]